MNVMDSYLNEHFKTQVRIFSSICSQAWLIFLPRCNNNTWKSEISRTLNRFVVYREYL